MKRILIALLAISMTISFCSCTEQDTSIENSSSSSSSESSELDASHANYELGISYYNKGDYTAAKEKLSKVIPKDSNYDNAQKVLREIETIEKAKSTAKTQSNNSEIDITTHETTSTSQEPVTTTTSISEIATSETVPVRESFEPVFSSAYASSTLKPISSNGTIYTYDANNVLDNNNKTCWCESVDGTGVGQSITITAVNPQNVGKIMITNGLCSDRESFYKNSRVKECRITLSDGTSFEYTLSGEFSEQPTIIRFNSNMVTTYIKLTILSTYPGSKYSDTCISEIKTAL